MKNVLFQHKGAPKKMRMIYSLLSLVLLILGIACIGIALMVKTRQGFTSTAIGSSLYVSGPSGISSSQKMILFGIGFIAILFAVILFSFINKRKTWYLEINDENIMGKGMLVKQGIANFTLSFNDIKEINIKSEGLNPSLSIFTNDGKTYICWIDQPEKAKKIIESKL